jgi:hypothetical protein
MAIDTHASLLRTSGVLPPQVPELLVAQLRSLGGRTVFLFSSCTEAEVSLADLPIHRGYVCQRIVDGGQDRRFS